MDKKKFTETILKNLGKEEMGSGMEKRSVSHPLKPTFLVVFTGTNSGIQEVIDELKRGKQDMDLDYILAFSWNGKDLLDVERIKHQLRAKAVYMENDKLELERILGSVKGVLWPMATQNSVAKLVLGIQDDFISTLLWLVLWKNIPLDVRGDSAVTFRKEKSKNPVLQEMVEERLVRLEKMGARVHKNPDFYRILKEHTSRPGKNSVFLNKWVTGSEGKAVMTEKDLRALLSEGKELQIPENTMLTPLAKDFLRSLNRKP